jgi:hypothetical protein
MNFDDLYTLALEAKGTKPGERFYNVSKSEGPSGISSSPIGKANYNPEIFKSERKDPLDKGMKDQVSIIKLLGKAFQLLKNDEVFGDQMRGIMNGFKKNRKQISAYQESIIKSKPKTIDNLWGRINRLITIVNDPKKRQDPSVADFEKELKELKAQKDEEQATLDDVFSQIENVAFENEELSESYLQQMLYVIRDTAKRLYKKQSDALMSDEQEVPQSRIVPLHELDYEMLQKEVEKSSQVQMQLLEMLLSSDDSNPLKLFLKLQEERYNDSKQNFFNASRGDNYSISIEQLYKNLPLFSLVNYFSHIILKSPAITLNTKQKKRADVLTKGDGMITRMGKIKNEREWEEIRPDLIAYLKDQKIDKNKKDMLINLANGPFQATRGKANAAIKIISSLKVENINESFDELASKYASSFNLDMNDFLIDLQEVNTLLESSGKRFKKVVKNKKTGRTKTVRYGQAGKAKDGGDRIRPGTDKGSSYCARSYGIKKRLPKDQQNDPNTPNNLSRKKWKCVGKTSKK